MEQAIKISSLINSCKPSQFFSCEEYLNALYLQMKKNCSCYSYRQLAADLGFAASNFLHLVVRGKRKLTVDAMAKISSSLKLPKDETRYLNLLVEISRAKSAEKATKTFRDLMQLRTEIQSPGVSASDFDYLSTWYFPVVLALSHTRSFIPDPDWIAGQVWPPISRDEAALALQFLAQKSRLPEENPSSPTPETIDHQSPLDAAASFMHLESLQHTAQALLSLPANQRYLSTLILPSNEVLRSKIQAELEELQKRLLTLTSEEPSESFDHVVRLQFQAYPASLEEERSQA